MPIITITKPTDQPMGIRRLQNELHASLGDERLSSFWMIVAFAKQGPLLRLWSAIDEWISHGNQINAIFGVDCNGTSRQALSFALEHFSHTYIAGIRSALNPTFHPKIYCFEGEHSAVAYVGSNNLTTGGLEINAESFVKVELNLPDDIELLRNLRDCWTETLTIARPLSRDLIEELSVRGVLLDENQARTTTRRNATPESVAIFPITRVLPPSPIPRRAIARTKATTRTEIVKVPADTSVFAPKALIIQIVPHHNGEVFLSKLAVDQNPIFFGWPFEGLTVPKKQGNPSYPQRVPDPVVTIIVFGESQEPILQMPLLNLNTVYYAPKSEIRVTVPPPVVEAVPPYSILIMERVEEESPLDYRLVIHTPRSAEYDRYLAVCNQDMPTGGKNQPRRFGWL